MDTVEGDYHNFSTSSSHRLPTISGSEAIRSARQDAKPISTSLARLDAILGRSSTYTNNSEGGVPRGSVTEVYGPPGVGKTTFALQLAVNALRTLGKKTSVTWIDTASQLVQSRFQQIAHDYRLPPGQEPPSSPPLPQPAKDASLVERFNYMQITTLPRLLTLFLHPPSSFPPPNTAVIVLDDFSNFILSSLPRLSPSQISRKASGSTPNARDAAIAKRTLSRRFQILSSLASSLQKFAASKNVAIIITSKASVNLKAGQRAALRPALSSQQWDNYLSVRIALFRDFWPESVPGTQKDETTEADEPTTFERRSLRFAKVVRLNGKLVSSSDVGFVIEKGGLRELSFSTNDADASIIPLSTQVLRPLEDVLDAAVNDSDDLRDDTDQIVKQGKAPIAVGESNDETGGTKRKAIEIDESEDEEKVDNVDPVSDDEAPVRAVTGQHITGFQPSSQVHRGDEDNESAKRKRSGVATSILPGGDETYNEEEDEMLLGSFVTEAPPFSQAALEMSEPLTPSDDGREFA